MRKLMVLAVMLAMMLAAASPAFADVTIEDSFNVYQPQSAFVFGAQTNSGNANAAAADESFAGAAVYNSFDVSVSQWIY